MDNICATCAALEQCRYRYRREEHEDGCEETLAKTVEKSRDEYRSAWFTYIREFED